MRVFGRAASTKGQLIKPVPDTVAIQELINAFRANLMVRGSKSIIGIGRQFRIFDNNGDRRLQYPEFAQAIKDMNLEITVKDTQLMFNAFDRNNDGTVDYDEFLRTVRGDLNEERRELVLKAFAMLD